MARTGTGLCNAGWIIRRGRVQQGGNTVCVASRVEMEGDGGEVAGSVVWPKHSD